jgi:hypothetical protein
MNEILSLSLNNLVAATLILENFADTTAKNALY